MTSQEVLEQVVAQLRRSADIHKRSTASLLLRIHGIQLDSWADDIEGELSRTPTITDLLAQAHKIFPGSEIELNLSTPERGIFGSISSVGSGGEPT